MKIKDVTTVIERVAPLETALDYDNVGLLVGDGNRECMGVLITVDVTRGALDEALKRGCNLIVAHHPVIFMPKKDFLADDYQAALIAEAFVKGVAIYAAHTNVDKMPGNMAYKLLCAIGVKNAVTFTAEGFGAIGDIEDKKLKDIEKVVSVYLADNRVFTVGDGEKIIRRIATINGAGADNETIQAARKCGADLFISADLKHHIMLEAKETGLCLMSVGHYASEKCFCDIVYDIIHRHSDTLFIYKYYEGNPYN